MSVKTVYSVCGMCGVRCPIEVAVENGVCRSIQGNRHSPGIRGAICVRGAAGIAALQDDERPQFPMRRQGARGEGRWQRISWGEALSHAAEKIAEAQSRHGGRSILWADAGGPFSDMRRALVRGLGSPNFFGREAFGAVNTHHAALSLFGFGADRLVYDLRSAREVVLQVRNLFESIDVQQANELLNGMADGGRLTVVDIRATVSAAKADRFLLIRPGTDLALNLAVIHTLLAEKLYDEAFAAKWVADLEALEHYVAGSSPEFAEAETGIAAGEIVDLARALAKAAPRVVWHPGGMTARYRDSFLVSRTAYIINALLGSIGARGGLPLAAGPEDLGQKGLNRLVDLFPAVAEKRADAAGAHPAVYAHGPGLIHRAFQAIESADPYPVKACVVYQNDPLSDLPDPARLKAIFEQLDFLVAITAAWTETAWHSDLVLPLSGYLERESIAGEIHGLTPSFSLRRRCESPRFDTRADWEIVCGLAGRLGLAPLALGSIEEIWNRQLEGTGVRLRDFEARGFVPLASEPCCAPMGAEFRFPTDSGRIEMQNARWRDQGLDCLKRVVARPGLYACTFRLVVGGCSLHVEGHTVNNPLLFKQMPENVLWIHPAAAGQAGIADGDVVTVSGPGGTGRIQARLTEWIHPEAVFMVRGFGRSLPVESRARGRGLADTALMGGGLELIDPLGGGLALQEHVVSVTKA
jgi:thiosulfate reductase/polysulfide reductase chain A